MPETVLKQLEMLTLHIKTRGLQVEPRSRISADLYTATAELLEAVDGMRRNQLEEEGAHDVMVDLEQKVPGAVSGILGLKRDMLAVQLRLKAVLLPLERFLGKDGARICRADPLAHRNDIDRSVSFYDERSLARILRMSWLKGVPDRINSLLENWEDVEYMLRQYLQAQRQMTKEQK